MFVKSTESFLEAFEKKFELKNEVLSEYSNLIFSLVSCSCFELKLFFKAFYKIFCDNLWALRARSRYQIGPSTVTQMFTSVKKSWSYDAPIKKYLQKTEKSCFFFSNFLGTTLAMFRWRIFKMGGVVKNFWGGQKTFESENILCQLHPGSKIISIA